MNLLLFSKTYFRPVYKDSFNECGVLVFLQPKLLQPKPLLSIPFFNVDEHDVIEFRRSVDVEVFDGAELG